MNWIGLYDILDRFSIIVNEYIRLYISYGCDILFESYKGLYISILALVIFYIIKSLWGLILKRRTKHIILPYLNTSLKSEYNFIDHAIDKYLLVESVLEFDIKNKLYINQIDKIYNDNVDKLKHDIKTNNFTELSNTPKDNPTIAVSFVHHNRDQSTEKDEAHWFWLTLYERDEHTENLLNEYRHSNKINIDVKQPEFINKSYPFISGLIISALIFFEYKNKKYLLYNSKNCDFFLNHNFSYYDALMMQKNINSGLYDVSKEISANAVNAVYIKDLMEDKLREFNIRTFEITDIGIDKESLYLRLFTTIEVDTPSNIRQQIKNGDCIALKKIQKIIKNREMPGCLKYYLIKIKGKYGDYKSSF